MEQTLEATLARLFASESAAARGPEPLRTSSDSAALSPDAAGLTRALREHLDRARQAQRVDDWTKYGEELRALEETLRALERLVE
jgi:uncharacterized membrane protein (UPF0182 family)